MVTSNYDFKCVISVKSVNYRTIFALTVIIEDDCINSNIFHDFYTSALHFFLLLMGVNIIVAKILIKSSTVLILYTFWVNLVSKPSFNLVTYLRLPIISFIIYSCNEFQISVTNCYRKKLKDKWILFCASKSVQNYQILGTQVISVTYLNLIFHEMKCLTVWQYAEMLEVWVFKLV